MVELKKDRKGMTWILTHTDSAGWHKQLNLTPDDLDELVSLWLTLSPNPGGLI